MARLIDGNVLAAALRAQVAAAVTLLRERHGVVPGLAVVLVGDDPASQVYTRNKTRACDETGIASFEHRLPADCGMSALIELIGALNAADRVDGILVQLPLPAGLDQKPDYRRARSGKGRGRLPSAQCRPAVERRARFCPVHAAGRDAASAQRPTRFVRR